MKKKIITNLRELAYSIQYGKHAPKYAQLLYVDPCEIQRTLVDGIFERKDSGRIAGGNWDLQTQPISSLPKFIICKNHFVLGQDWSQAGAYQHMKNLIEKTPGVDGCYTEKDIIERYKKLDELFQQIKHENRMKTRSEIKHHTTRESGGIYIHIARNCEPIFGGGGIHRLAIAKIIKLKEIPVQLGVIHADAIKTWKSNPKIRSI